MMIYNNGDSDMCGRKDLEEDMRTRSRMIDGELRRKKNDVVDNYELGTSMAFLSLDGSSVFVVWTNFLPAAAACLLVRLLLGAPLPADVALPIHFAFHALEHQEHRALDLCLISQDLAVLASDVSLLSKLFATRIRSQTSKQRQRKSITEG